MAIRRKKKPIKEIVDSASSSIVGVLGAVDNTIKVYNNSLNIINGELEAFAEVRHSTVKDRIELAKMEEKANIAEAKAEFEELRKAQ